MRRFIAYARERCGPRLSEKAADKLANQYVLMRSGSTRYEQESGKRCAIPITVRLADFLMCNLNLVVNFYMELLRLYKSTHLFENLHYHIFITLNRQLEAIIRISESIAKMRLAAFANETDVEEALRLFHVSTLEAAMSGNLEGAEGFTTQEDHELILRVEKQLKRRFVIGSQVSEYAIVQDFAKQVL